MIKCHQCGFDGRPLYRIKRQYSEIILCYNCGKNQFGELWTFEHDVEEIREGT